MKNRLLSAGRRGFSMLELLIVLSIMVIVATFVVPALASMVRGTPITVASQLLSSQLAYARQAAITRNHAIEVRFIRYGDPEMPGEDKTNPKSGHFRAIQLMEILDSGAAVVLDRVRVFPTPAILSDDVTLSSLLDPNQPSGAPTQQLRTPDQTVDPRMTRGVEYNYQYVPFRFLQNGSTNLLPTPTTNTTATSGGNGLWFVTIQGANEPNVGTAPANFFTIQVDAVSGGIRSFRPGLQ